MKELIITKLNNFKKFLLMKIRKLKKVKAFKHKDVKKTFILECACGTSTHRLVMTVEYEAGMGCINVAKDYDMNFSFFERVRDSFNYIFFKQPIITHEFVVRKKDIKQIIDFVKELQNSLQYK